MMMLVWIPILLALRERKGGAKGQLARVKVKAQERVKVGRRQHRAWTLTKRASFGIAASFLSLSSVFPGEEGVKDLCDDLALKVTCQHFNMLNKVGHLCQQQK